MKKWKNLFGFIFADEIHRFGAEGASTISNKFNPKIRGGCSATPKRVDGLDVIIDEVFGPVTAHGTADQLQCDARFIETGYNIPKFFRYTTMETRLVNNEERNDSIVENVIKDVKDGYHCMITTKRVAHIKNLTEKLKDEGIVAVAYYGSLPKGVRKQILEDYRKGYYEVLVSNRSMTQTGLDLPLLSSIHVAMYNGNIFNLEQEINRVRTPYKNLKVFNPRKRRKFKIIKEKPIPRVNFYVDTGHGVSYAARNNFKKIIDQEGLNLVEGFENVSDIKKSKSKKDLARIEKRKKQREQQKKRKKK